MYNPLVERIYITMKKALKFIPLCTLILAAASFVLLMVTHALSYTASVGSLTVTNWYSGFAVIFGQGDAVLANISLQFEGTLAWNALIAWILIGAATVLLLISTFASMGKKSIKASGLFTLVSAGLLIAGGILLFFTKDVFNSVNNNILVGDWNLGIGWFISAILAIISGALSAFPALLAVAGKK